MSPVRLRDAIELPFLFLDTKTNDPLNQPLKPKGPAYNNCFFVTTTSRSNFGSSSNIPKKVS